jgi:hypothetical protein
MLRFVVVKRLRTARSNVLRSLLRADLRHLR